jgi:hypothetical protein
VRESRKEKAGPRGHKKSSILTEFREMMRFIVEVACEIYQRLDV